MSIKISTDQFIKKAEIIHNYKYGYDMVEYITHTCKITIICKIHGPFMQTPQSHLQNHGCPICGINNRKSRPCSTTDQFIKKAKNIHHDRYDYSCVDYKSAKEKIIIICNIHGKFIQNPNDHLSNHGCPHCGGIESNKKIPASSRIAAGIKSNNTIKLKGTRGEIMRRRSEKFNSLPISEKLEIERIRIFRYQTSRTKNGNMVPIEKLSLFMIYRRIVNKFTKQSLKENNYNLLNYKKRGPIEKGGWHIDHQLSKQDGFLLNIPPCIIGNICNLMMLPGVVNCKKSYKSWITPNELFERYFNKNYGGGLVESTSPIPFHSSSGTQLHSVVI